MPRSLWLKIRLYTLWLRWAWPFNWAHHPLCERFDKDVLRLGPLHACRSCVAVYTGIVMTGIACWVWSERLVEINPLWIVVIAGVTVVGSFPRIYKNVPRIVRDILRGGMGVLIALALALILSGNWPVGIPMTIILALFWYVYFKIRKGRRLRSCEGCPEFTAKGICNGYSLQVARIRCYEEAATDLVEQYGPLPFWK